MMELKGSQQCRQQRRVAASGAPLLELASKPCCPGGKDTEAMLCCASSLPGCTGSDEYSSCQLGAAHLARRWRRA